MFGMNATRAIRAIALGGCVLSAAMLPACGSTQTRETDSGEVYTGSGATLRVGGLGCPMCAESIDVLMREIDGVRDVHVNLESGAVVVDFEPGAAIRGSDMAAAVIDGGFTLRSIESRE